MRSRSHDPVTGVHAVIDGERLGGPTVDASFHVDDDLICPRCLSWISADEYVRRSITDVVEHESCPRSRRGLPSSAAH